ncbi:POTRA domain-containing protein [uncultured Paludibaculum sp.]|uniref:POTRA domain-containing protein n=1 Tax=uncultured Paludibaculum sp. TaxID=1765020 RepID=UPI002AAC38A2|nr:POTRA domain-containing protein [uncultured Paludibaculum sp.]
MNQPGLCTALLTCLLAGAAPTWGSDDLSALYGRPIASIRFEPEQQPLSKEQLQLLIGLKPGDPLAEAALSKAIERLWTSGRYIDIVAEGEAKSGGVEITFRTTQALFVSRVSVEGVPEPPNPAQLTGATKMGLGDPFEESMVPGAVESLEEVLRNNGFYVAKIRHELSPRPETEEMDIRFYVDPGPRAKLTRPVFEGEPALSERKLIRLTNFQRWYGLRGWKDMDGRRLQRAVEKMRDAYLKTEHLEATIRIASVDYDPKAVTVKPHFLIHAGPSVFVKTEGAKVSKGQMRRLLPIYQERTVDRELLLEGQMNLQHYFEQQGFYNAKVTYSLADPTPDGARTILFRIQKGPRYKLVHLEVSGNKYFDKGTIAERLRMIPARFPRYRRGQFSRQLMEQDEASILDLYRSNGFRDAEVKAVVEPGYKGKATDLGVGLQIKEGSQWFVTDLELTGVDLKLLEVIRGFLSLTPGQPYSVSSVAADRDNVLNWYFNNGYPDATFDASIVEGDEPNRIKLKYTVTEGRRNFVRDVLVRGLKATRPELVNNRLAVTPGQPLSQSSIVETQRRLYDLGIFAKVDVAVQNPEGRERDKYVLLQVEEAKKYSLNLGFGAEFGRIGGGSNSFDAPAGASGFSPRGQIGITRSNIFGLAHTASATVRVSSIQQRLLASYLAPQFLGRENFNLTFSSLVDRSRDVRTYTSNRSESSVQLGQKVSRGITLQYRATARFVFIDKNSLKIDPTLIPIYSQPVKTIAASASFIQDHRDDPLDARRGFYNTLDAGYAVPFSQNATNYFRLVAKNSTYHPLRREVIFARTTSFGWLHNLDNEPVPLPENFYAGGASTHRGFPDNQAGPRDLITGYPIGGAAFLFFQHELRFPLVGTNLTGVLFHDMGNVFSSLDDISFRYRQKDQQDFNYTVQAMGFGFRIKTPVGPLRLDLAYAPNTPRFVGFVGSRDDLINGTGQYNVPQRVSRFQWHFSIGQAF